MKDTEMKEPVDQTQNAVSFDEYSQLKKEYKKVKKLFKAK